MKRIIITGLFAVLAYISINAQGYSVGDEAADFKLKSTKGDLISLYDYDEASKGAIVIFTCNHCPYAKAYEDRIIALDKKFKTMGYPVIAINPNDPEIVPEDSFENMVKRANEKNFSFPYLFDEKQETYKIYGATRTPHVYLLTKEGGQFKVAYIGAIDDNYKNPSAVGKEYLSDAVMALLDGKQPNPDFTKAIGCTIKSKK